MRTPATTLLRSAILLLTLGAATGFAQSLNPSTSGALLTINGTVTDGTNTTNVNLLISDKDIHSGIPRTVAPSEDGNCTSADAISTDAYILQGGAPTGCDPGEGFESGISDGFASLSATIPVAYTFSINTHYQCLATEGGCSNDATRSNTSGSVSSADTGFLTVTLGGAATSFTGTITLGANSKSCGTSLFDSFTGTLLANNIEAPAIPADINSSVDSVVLALSNDSSECGGFNGAQTQTQTLGASGTTTTYTFNTDTYKVTGITNQGGEQLTVEAVLIPASSFPAISALNGQTCIPYGDYSSGFGQDTCVEFQTKCQNSATDTTPCNFLYLLATGYDLPADLSGGIGGPGFWVAHGVDCPLTTNSVVQNIFLAYEATIKDPTTKGSSLGPSCFVATYTPGAPAITSGTFSGFVGWDTPVSDTTLNVVHAGAAVPLKFQVFDSLGNPVQNLSFCNNVTTNTTVNGSSFACLDSPAPAGPWVNLGYYRIYCSTDVPLNTSDVTLTAAGGSGFQNLGGGNYQFNWKTPKILTGCVNIEVVFSSGLIVVPSSPGFSFK